MRKGVEEAQELSGTYTPTRVLKQHRVIYPAQFRTWRLSPDADSYSKR